MNDKLFRQMLTLLLHAAEEQRDIARCADDHTAGDMWSAVAGLLDNARQRIRR